MKTSRVLFFAIAAIFATATLTHAQTAKRSTTKTDRFDFASGGTVAIAGAPTGSIRIVGWQKNEIEITAVISIEAPTEADLDKLAAVTTFTTDESPARTGIVSVGTNDKKLVKKLGKKLPKNLIGLPFTINYVISVPRYCDLEIDGGKGDLTVEGVEGNMQINFLETRAKVEVINGAVMAVIGKGSVDVAFGTRGWRGRAATISLASGDLTVRLPTNMSSEVDATVMNIGKIENTFPDLKPRDRKVAFTDKAISAKAGVGGVPLKFSVGDGTLKLQPLVLPF